MGSNIHPHLITDKFVVLGAAASQEILSPEMSLFRVLPASEPILAMQMNKHANKVCFLSSIPLNYLFYKNFEGVVKKSYGAYVEELNLIIQCTHPQYGGKGYCNM